MTGRDQEARRISIEAIDEWLANWGSARNTIATGIVVVDRLSQKCPLVEEDVFTSRGEIIGARSALPGVLERNGVPPRYLREVTNRQAATYARDLLLRLSWGQTLADLAKPVRESIVSDLMEILKSHATEWLTRQKLRVPLDSRLTPSRWVSDLFQSSRDRSTGIVEQHIVGAKLERRFPNAQIDNHPAHAADRQTGREGDYTVARIVYHVTANPAKAVIEKCLANVRVGKHPVLVVPRDKVTNALAWAENLSAEALITVIALEDFIALNVIEIAIAEGKERIDVMREIFDAYNRRLKEVETDLSLMIEID